LREIHVINQAASVKADDFTQALAAVQLQLDQDFAPVWGLTVKLVEAPPVLPTDRTPPTAETIYVLGTTNQADALGYHLFDGRWPVGYVFADTAKSAGLDWCEVLSHEAIEQAVNPFAEDFMGTTDRNGVPIGVAKEPADPVESATYRKGGRTVTDFVFPEWFRRGPGATFDYLGKLHAPLSLLPGGYIPVTRDLRTFTQVFGAKVPLAKRCPDHYSRMGRILQRNRPHAAAL
jgi:hypothetical protein